MLDRCRHDCFALDGDCHPAARGEPRDAIVRDGFTVPAPANDSARATPRPRLDDAARAFLMRVGSARP